MPFILCIHSEGFQANSGKSLFGYNCLFLKTESNCSVQNHEYFIVQTIRGQSIHKVMCRYVDAIGVGANARDHL